MTPIMPLLAAVAAAPSCPAPVGQPVAITSTILPVEAMGGAYRSGNGWPPPGEPRIGLIRYEWGLLLQSADPHFANFDLSPGPVHSRSSGCWFQWAYRWGERGVEAITGPHIGESGYRAGYTPEQPADPPAITGYRFVMADKAFSPDLPGSGCGTPRTAARGRRSLPSTINTARFWRPCLSVWAGSSHSPPPIRRRSASPSSARARTAGRSRISSSFGCPAYGRIPARRGITYDRNQPGCAPRANPQRRLSPRHARPGGNVA